MGRIKKDDILQKKIVFLAIAAPIILGIFLFIPAGTLNYWQAWAYMCVLLVPAYFVIGYFMKNDPEFLERRLRTKEKETAQQKIIKIGTILFAIGFIMPGLDQRFGWSNVPNEISIIADFFVLIGYVLIIIVFKENSYAGRTIQVDEGQRVIATGPYSIIRHPMYLGTSILYLATPFALGSYYAFPFFAAIIPILLFRIFNEEEVLRKELKGYTNYCTKVKYRLIPYVW